MSSSYLNHLLLQSLQGSVPQARSLDGYLNKQPSGYDRYEVYKAEQSAPDISEYAQQLFSPKPNQTTLPPPPTPSFRVPDAIRVNKEPSTYSEEPVLPGGYGSMSASFSGGVPYRDSASKYVRSALQDVDKFVSNSEEAQSDQDNFYKAMQSLSSQKLYSLGDMGEENQAFIEALDKNKADQEELVKRFETLKVQPESGGKTALKAIALALGAFGSSLTGTPDRTLDIIESTAKDAAQKLSSNREHTANLLGLNKQEREAINERYKTKTEYAKYLENSILSYQAQRLKAQESTAKNRIDSANARLASANIQAKIDENNANTAKEYAKLSIESGTAKGFVPQPTTVFNIPSPVWNSIDKDVAKGLREKGNALASMYSIIDKIKTIANSSSITDRDKVAQATRYRDELATMGAKGKSLGVISDKDYERILSADPFSLTTSKSTAMADLDAILSTAIVGLKSDIGNYGTINPDLERKLFSGGSL